MQFQGTKIRRSYSTTPKKITSDVSAFCASISPKQPVFIEITLDNVSRVSECFHNAADFSKRQGGEVVFGWCIWKWEGAYIEAEHHAVIRTGEGLIDITPQGDGEEKILFLEDPLAVYDYENEESKPTIRKALSERQSVQSFLSAVKKFDDFIAKHRRGREIITNRLQFREMFELKLLMRDRMIEDMFASTKTNDMCFCGSGKKFKKCCKLRCDAVLWRTGPIE